jgi:hypothetical protein
MQLKKIKIIKLSILFTEKTKKKKHTIFSDTCEIKFVVSSITMYNMWCLLWHILHENDNLTLGNGKHITQEPWLFAWEKPHSLVGHELLYASSNGRFYWFTHCFDEGQMLWQQWATPLEHDHHFFFHRLMKKKTPKQTTGVKSCASSNGRSYGYAHLDRRCPRVRAGACDQNNGKSQYWIPRHIGSQMWIQSIWVARAQNNGLVSSLSWWHRTLVVCFHVAHSTTIFR